MYELDFLMTSRSPCAIAELLVLVRVQTVEFTDRGYYHQRNMASALMTAHAEVTTTLLLLPYVFNENLTALLCFTEFI